MSLLLTTSTSVLVSSSPSPLIPQQAARRSTTSLLATMSTLSTTTTTTTTSSSTNKNKNTTSSTTTNATTPHLNNAHTILPMIVPVTAPPQVRNEALIQVVQTLCPFMNPANVGKDRSDSETKNTISATSWQVTPLSGGLSNLMFVVSSSSHGTKQEQQSVLVRVHSTNNNDDNKDDDSTDATTTSSSFALVDTTYENAISAWLSSITTNTTSSSSSTIAAGVSAPKYYGRFQNGRVEEFYHHHEPLSWSEMNQYSPDIARLLAGMHARVPPTSILPPLSLSNSSSSSSNNNKVAWKHNVQSWLDFCKSHYGRYKTTSKGHPSNERHLANGNQRSTSTGNHLLDLDNLEAEFQWLQAQLVMPPKNGNNHQSNQHSTSSNSTAVKDKVVAYSRQVVFCHGDAQSLNLLKPTKRGTIRSGSSHNEGALKLIDYEYCGWNPRAFDIANTFLEYCDMNNIHCCNYAIQYPTSQQQNDFLQAYLQAMGDYDEFSLEQEFFALSNSSNASNKERATTRTTTMNGGNNNDNDLERTMNNRNAVLELFQEEIGKHTLISHLHWTLWSLVQNVISDIEFDYLAYAQLRMEGYYYFRQLYFSEEDELDVSMSGGGDKEQARNVR